MADATQAEDFAALAHDVKNLVETWQDSSVSHKEARALTERLEKFSNLDNDINEHAHLAKFASTLSTILRLRATISPTAFITIPTTGLVPVGTGSFSTVYRGTWNNEEVAVKVFPQLLQSGNDKIIEDPVKSFTREFRVWNAVAGQPKLWHLRGFSIWIDVDLEDVRLLLVSPLATGDLAKMSRDILPNKDQIVTSILDIALGLKTLHDFDIIHGDLRASNVLCSEGHCYLIDFSIAIMPASSSSTLDTFAKMTPRGWAAPELDEQTRSKQSDIFSFACTIYEMFTQRPPYDGSSTAEDRSKLPRRIGRLMRDEWNKLWEILEVCWSADPLDRPTASDLESMLPEIAGLSLSRSSFLMADATQTEDFEPLALSVKNLIETWQDLSVSHKEARALTKRLEKFSTPDNEYALFASTLSTLLRLRATISPTAFIAIPTTGLVPIGTGSFGRIYRGMWNKEEVAVKVFPQLLHDMLEPGNDKVIEDPVKSFTREFRAWNSVSGQPRLWPLRGFSIWIDVDFEDVRLLLVSSLATGDLAKMSRDILCNKDQIVTSILDIALGLKTLHDFDIIHGDLRASNVLCSKGHCYLIDFGVSKLPAISTLTTFAKMVHGGWAAPELDEQSRSKQSDIFSFACTIYEMFNHRSPYDWNSSAEDRSKLPRRIGRLMHKYWNKLWEILEVCWSADPLDRPTASDLEARLRKIFQPLS